MKDSKELRELEQLCEAMTKEVCKIKEKIEELKNKKEKLVADSWEEAIEGKYCYWFDQTSEIKSAFDVSSSAVNHNCIPTKELAKAELAKCQLATIMYDAWGEWRPDWTDSDIKKHTISFEKNTIKTDYHYTYNQFLCFPTLEMRDEFLNKHRDLIMKARLAL